MDKDKEIKATIKVPSISVSSVREAEQIQSRADSAIASIGSYYTNQGLDIPPGAEKLIDLLDCVMVEADDISSFEQVS